MDFGQGVEYIFFLVLLAAIFTTAVSNGYGFLTRLCAEFNLSYKSVIAFFMLAAVIVSQVGFSNMVSKLYSLFGYIGIFEVIIILYILLVTR